MYKITIQTDSRKDSAEAIQANFWLSYHILNSLYDVKESAIDEAFKTAEKGPCEIHFNGKTFTIEMPEYNPDRAKHELKAVVNILNAVIQNAEDENKDLISLAVSFTRRTSTVLNLIEKSM